MIPATDYTRRLQAVAKGLEQAQADALLVTPGADLEYLTGYRATALERLTCLVLTASGEATLVVPQLEEAAAMASPVESLPVAVHTWPEGDDPLLVVASSIRDVPHSASILVSDRMWASRVLALQERFPQARWLAADEVVAGPRMRKSAAEAAELQAAGAAIDAAHSLVPGFLAIGATEREVAARIRQAMLDHGHESVDFVIVASGPNSASPHHEPGDRAIGQGDPVVVDIGGAIRSGYRSDSTRTYSIGSPSASFARDYDALLAAQADGVAAAAAGATCEEVDRACRRRLEGSGLGEYFIHRTGHGIGLETHEPPYIMEGNPTALEPGVSFSVEPGFYRPGQYGARIEDIVICTDGDPIVCNSRPRELLVVNP